MISPLLLSCLLAFQWSADDELARAINHANELFRSQHYEEALQEYLDLYQKNPDNDLLAYNLANAYQVLGMGEKAQELYQAARGGNAKTGDSKADRVQGGEKPADLALYNSGSAHLEENRFVDAVTNLVDYLKKHPEDMDAKRNLELALQRMKQQSQEQQQQDQQDKQEQQNQQNQEGESPQEQPTGEGDQQQEKPPEGGEQSSAEEQGESSEPGTPEDRSERGDQPSPAEQGQEQETDWNEQMKQQILQALADQEQKTQAEHRARKSGPVTRRARDW